MVTYILSICEQAYWNKSDQIITFSDVENLTFGT